MAEYQYRCKDCKTVFTVIKSITDVIITFCPSCKSDKVQQKYFAPHVLYKGKGFYKTDNTKKPLTETE